jgi:hypothetical protein
MKMTESAEPHIRLFDDGVKRLNLATEAAVAVSERNMGVYHTGRQNRALFLLAKLIAHDMSILAIIDRYRFSAPGAALLDHFSIAALGRTSVEASLMTMYISHPTLTQDEWNLRRHILYLHDLTSRRRFLGTSAQKRDEVPFFENYGEAKNNLKTKITTYGKAVGYSDERITEFLKGQTIFVDGARGAVREAGWDVDAFDFYQTYLSSFVHSHPVSFMRADEHKISFSNPSPFQLGICGTIADLAAGCTEDVEKRMVVFSNSDGGDPLGQVD